MEQLVSIRQCGREDVAKTVALSQRVLKALKAQNHSDYFGGVDEDEIVEAMEKPSIVIIASDESGEIVGFLLLKKPNKEEEKNILKTLKVTARGKRLLSMGLE